MPTRTYTATERTGAKQDERWGLYSARDGYWLPVIYRSQRDAIEAEKVVNGPRVRDY